MQQCKQPKGRMGRMIMKGMNSGHSSLAAWALEKASWRDNAQILDIGCGGGAAIARMLKNIFIV